MSNVSEFQSASSKRIEQASEWVAKLDRGLTHEEEQALGDWLSISDKNRQEFLQTAKDWDRMDSLSRLADIFPEKVEQTVSSIQRGWGIAAAFLLVLSSTIVWLGWDQIAETANPNIVAIESSGKYETAIGEQSLFYLSDGTKMVLNTNSAVVVNYSDNARLLMLERGEIHVSVAHDPARPLSVMVGDKVVQAVGTEFNVEITSDQSVELMVTEGVVMIGVLDNIAPSQSKQDSPILLQKSSRLIAAGQEAVIKTTKDKLGLIEAKQIKAEEIAVKLSWREGNLIFRGESLEEAVSEVGRYTAVEFVFLDEESKKIKVVGLFRAGDVDGLLTALHNNFNISYEWAGEDKILLSGQ